MIEIVREYYDDALRYVDTQQEEIVSHLQQLGILDQSILLFISDHGEDLYLRSGPAHGVNLYNTQIRIPFVLCGPGVSPGVRTDNVSLLDVGPTLLHLAGLPSHPSFEGQNVLAPPPHFPRPIFVYNDFIRRSTAVISGSYKFIRSYSRHTEELYNTRRDPLERNDLSQKQPDIAHVLRWILEQEEMRR
jgi:choline-sulfatase